MTNTTNPTATLTAPPLDPGPLAPGDPRLPFAGAVALARTGLGRVAAADAGRPTPCPDFTVGDLAAHLVAVVRRVAGAARGDDPATLPSMADDVTPGAWVEAFTAGAHDVQAAFADDAVLGRVLHLPFASLPAPVVLGIYTSELTVHTWDLAQAMGWTVAWDDAVLAPALATMQVGLPAEGRAGAPFDDVVPTAPASPLIDRLVAWSGRRP